MSTRSPVLEALKDYRVKCRLPECDNQISPLEARWFKWGQFGYCSNNCWEKAKEKHDTSTAKGMGEMNEN